ncbi:uncharacterized protein LOC114072435 [Empidonax traillii]|uniref:uncharacterized protein LOC114072435 n=1 Tax=Empidonax traillii TaxID=164674 RepID=UPI000FFCEE9F|nr:uncharacterized protein LOC114072435 [Empidonax traillii]
MTCPDAEGHPVPRGHQETKTHLGSETHHSSMVHQGSEDHQETKAHLGSVATQGSMASWGSLVNQDHQETWAHLGSVTPLGSMTHQGSQDHLETEAHLGSETNQSFMGDQDSQDHPEPSIDDGSMVLLDSKVSQGSTRNQGSEDHPESQVSQVSMTHVGSVANQHSQDHSKTKVHPGSVANQGSMGNQDPLAHTEPNADDGSMVLLDSKVNKGSMACIDLKVHQDSVASHACEDPREPKVNQDSMTNQSATSPVEAKVNEDPVVCLNLRVHQDPVANQAPEDPQEPKANQDPMDHLDTQVDQDSVALIDLKVHQAPRANPADPQETKVNHGSTACLGLRVHQDTAAKGRCTTRPGTESHRPPPPPWATAAPRPCPHVPSGTRLGLVLLTLGSLVLPCAWGSALEFGGAPGQWARYGRWAPGAGGQLSFRLKTNVTRALLLYLDDGGNCDFLELLVAEGRLRLRFAIACAEPATLEPPAPVSDGRWHTVLLTRHARHAALAVDGEARAATVRSKRPDMAVASDLFVGGIPPDVRLSALTLSTVKYEPPFRGWVADLRVGDAPAALLGAQGVRGDGDERCAHHPPCAHGGRCALHRGEPRCDCTGTGHRGPFCEEEEEPAVEGPAHLRLTGQGPAEVAEGGPGRGAGEIQQAAKGRTEYVATFRGSEFFCYDVSRSPVQSSADELALAFRTRQRHGLLLHTGRAADFLNLSLKAGAVWLVINLGAGAFEALVEPVNGKFHDGGWHHVRVTRNLRQHAGIGHAMVNKLHYLVVITLLLLLGFAVAPPPPFGANPGDFGQFSPIRHLAAELRLPHAKKSWFPPQKILPERACVTRWG